MTEPTRSFLGKTIQYTVFRMKREKNKKEKRQGKKRGACLGPSVCPARERTVPARCYKSKYWPFVIVKVLLSGMKANVISRIRLQWGMEAGIGLGPQAFTFAVPKSVPYTIRRTPDLKRRII